jgi:hypothetical protein
MRLQELDIAERVEAVEGGRAMSPRSFCVA